MTHRLRVERTLEWNVPGASSLPLPNRLTKRSQGIKTQKNPLPGQKKEKGKRCCNGENTGSSDKLNPGCRAGPGRMGEKLEITPESVRPKG